ncbi:MAG TPA: TlpA disulfide reductase family protein [Solirubrobacteraceae bacterium]|nr:TlpA disulfide reductase family protein [Solirubrobacteraceae bacterium]
MSDEPDAPREPELTRLDPDAVARAARPVPNAAPPPVIDVRPYRWAIGIIGLTLVVVIGVVQFLTHGRATTGVAPGHRLRWFAAARADTGLRGDANLHPTCRMAAHDPRALNLCIDAHRAPVVVSFFLTSSPSCVAQVDALQALSGRDRGIEFLAVAVHATRAATLRLVRSHHWTIPVAEDPDGAVGEQYGVVACPMVELAARGGIVRDRLIGDRWTSVAALAPRVAALTRGGTSAG